MQLLAAVVTKTTVYTTYDVIHIDVQANLEMYLIEPILKPQ